MTIVLSLGKQNLLKEIKSNTWHNDSSFASLVLISRLAYNMSDNAYPVHVQGHARDIISTFITPQCDLLSTTHPGRLLRISYEILNANPYFCARKIYLRIWRSVEF